MLTQTLNDASSRAAGLRVILMPGAFHSPEQFVEAGFDSAVRARYPQLNLVVAAPQLEHLSDRRWIKVLHDEVIVPARRDTTPLWLGGVSLGAFKALRFAAQYPDAIDGLCLLAPYLGSRLVAAEIKASGGIAGWRAQVQGEDDDERRVWQYVAGLGSSAHATPVFLGYGRADRFADTQQLLAHSLPVARSTTNVMEGGHDWPVWRQLWDRFLQRYGTPA
jgi:pimeloyl-ACP methyl ester carboxylesterase